MAWKKTDDTYYGEIASAIRSKNGTNNTYQPSQMAKAIKYSIPLVNLEEKDVLFYDYEGILWYSYSFAEALALTELPPLPAKKGMIAQEWNWNLQEIQNRASDGRMTLVGAIYTTDDGSTRLYFQVAKKTRLENLQIWVNMDGNQSSTVDWGDGTTSTISNTSSSRTAICAEKNDYTVVDKDTEIIVSIKGGNFLFGRNYGNEPVNPSWKLAKIEFGNNCCGYAAYGLSGLRNLSTLSMSNIFTEGGNYKHINEDNSLKAFIQPRNLIKFNNVSGDGNLYNLLIYISSPLTKNLLRFNSSIIRKYCFPDIIESISDVGYTISSNCLEKVELPKKNGLIYGMHTIKNNKLLQYLKIPKGVSTIKAQSLYNNTNLQVLDLTDYDDPSEIPTLEDVNAFQNNNPNCIYLVKNQSMYDAFTSATNWADFANNYQIDS